MIRKCQNHRPQAYPRHREEETQHIDSHNKTIAKQSPSPQPHKTPLSRDTTLKQSRSNVDTTS